jgi:hypothetical protein
VAEFTDQLKDKVGLWMVSAPRLDVAERVWDVNAPIRECGDRRALAQILALAPEAPVVLDSVYKNIDEEYLDVKFLQEALQ